MIARPQFFPHRKNKDGSFDSFCLKCFATVARATLESELGDHERAHVCDDMFAAKRSFLQQESHRSISARRKGKKIKLQSLSS